MESFEFLMRAKLCAGEDALDHLPYEMMRMNAKKPLVLTDKTLMSLGLYDVLETAAEGLDCSVVFDDVPPDSSLLKVEEAARFYRENGCDSVVALGGGSVIDTAKGVVTMISRFALSVGDVIGCEEPADGVFVPFVAVPTTAGTGSEATSVAVVADTEKQVKLEIIAQNMLPSVAILDPRMTVGLPPRVTAATAADALCHAIEAYTCLQKNPVSDAFAVGAIKMILSALPAVLENPKNKTERLHLAIASFMAGVAFSNSMVGAVHAIGHALGATCHIPHGEAMAILLPAVMRFNGFGMYKDLSPLFGSDDVPAAVAALMEKLNKKTGMPIRLSQTGKCAESDFETVAVKALNDGAVLFNPKAVSKNDVLALLKEVF